MKQLHTFALIFCLIWLVGHSTVRVFDWEFWFALGFTVYAGVNLVREVRAEQKKREP